MSDPDPQPAQHPDRGPPPAAGVEPVNAADLAQDPSQPDADDGLGAAGRSLGDALALSFRVLRWLFAVLLAVFLLGGCFTVDSNQVAVRTTFGRIVGDGGRDYLDSDGGLYFRWPRPIGEVYFVPTTSRTLRIDDAFVFRQGRERPGERLANLDAGADYEPGVDGMLLTGDASIVFARYAATYRVLPEDAPDFVRNLAGPREAGDFRDLADEPERLFERAEVLVDAAVREAVVAAEATRTFEQSLRNQRRLAGEGEPDPADGEAGEAEAEEGGEAVRDSLIESITQRKLDDLNVGVTIIEVARDDFSVPPPLRPITEAYTQSIQRRRQIVGAAGSARRTALTAAAGPAYPAVVAALDAYEAADRRAAADPDSAQAADALAAADAALKSLFLGEPAGDVLPGLAEALPADDPRRAALLETAAADPAATVSGEAFQLVRAAETEANDLVRRTESEIERFERLLPDYRRRPEVVRRQLLAAAVGEILGREDVVIRTTPGGQSLELLVGPDPDIRAQDQQRQIDRNRQARPAGPNPQR